MMAKSIFTFLLLTIGCLIAMAGAGQEAVAQTQNVKIQSLGGGRFMTEAVRELPADGVRSLRIVGPQNLGGSIIVRTHSSSAARLELRKIFKVTSEAEAANLEREVLYDFQAISSVLELRISTRVGAPWESSDPSARVEITLSIPRDWDLEIRGRFLEMDLSGPFRRADVETEYGRIKLTSVSQKTRLVGNYTAIEISNLKGDIVAQTSFADLIVRDAIPSAERPARLTDRNGSIVIEKLAGAVVAESENAPIFLSNVVLLGAGSSLRSANAMIKADIAEFADAELDIRNNNGAVILRVPKSLSARLNCAVGTGGSIQTGGLEIQTHPNLLGVGRLEGVVGTGKGVIDIDIAGPGQIGIQGT